MPLIPMAPVRKSPSGFCHIRVSVLDGISVTKEQENHLRRFRLLLTRAIFSFITFLFY